MEVCDEWDARASLGSLVRGLRDAHADWHSVGARGQLEVGVGVGALVRNFDLNL